jgi:transcriptional regulator
MSEQTLGLLKGTLDVLVLKALSWGPLHGYAVSRWIQHVTDDALEVQEGVLYPALHRLERKGLLRSEWGHSDTARRVKLYELTPEGMAALEGRESDWARYTNAVAKVLGATEQPS